MSICGMRGVEMGNLNKILVPGSGKENNIVHLRGIRRRWKINIEVGSVVQGAFSCLGIGSGGRLPLTNEFHKRLVTSRLASVSFSMGSATYSSII
jgi:hypothetical protein